MTTATATLVGETPGIVGYGGKVTVGSPGVVAVVVAVVAVTIRAAGAGEVSSVFESVFSVVALTVSMVSILAAVCSAGTVVDDFALSSVWVVACGVSGVEVVSGVAVVSVVGVVVLEPVSVGFGFSVGVGFSVVGSVVGSVVVCVDPEVVVPDPPEALTDVVGPSPEVVVDVVVSDVPEVDVLELDVLEVVVPEVLPLVESAFDPVSEFAEGSDWPSPVLADATPCPVATAIPRPTANASPLARLARLGRFACLPRLADAIARSRTPPSNGPWDPGSRGVLLINCGET